jgi:hypothetical protein
MKKNRKVRSKETEEESADRVIIYYCLRLPLVTKEEGAARAS